MFLTGETPLVINVLVVALLYKCAVILDAPLAKL